MSDELSNYIERSFKLNDQEAMQMAKLFKKEEIKKGDFFLKEQQYCNRLSFIQSGYIRIFTHFNDKEVTQWISSPSYFVTELASFLYQQRARFNFQALEDCVLYSISQEDYNRLAQVVPRWAEVERYFLGACFITIEDRVTQLLALSAEERYQRFYESQKQLFLEVPQQYLASMLGMTPETFSRIRAKQRS